MNYSVQDLLFYFLKHFTNSLSSEYGSFRVEFEFADISSLPSSHVATYFLPPNYHTTTPLMCSWSPQPKQLAGGLG